MNRFGHGRGDVELMPAIRQQSSRDHFCVEMSLPEKFFHLLRFGVRVRCRNLRLRPSKKIAHAAADPERSEAGGLEAWTISGNRTHRFKDKE